MGGTGRFFDSHMIYTLVITILSRVLTRPSILADGVAPFPYLQHHLNLCKSTICKSTIWITAQTLPTALTNLASHLTFLNSSV